MSTIVVELDHESHWNIVEKAWELPEELRPYVKALVKLTVDDREAKGLLDQQWIRLNDDIVSIEPTSVAIAHLTLHKPFKSWGWVFLSAAVILGGVAGFFLNWQISTPSIPDFSGEWDYECVAIDKDYRHGGICKMETRRTDYGIEFRIIGQRKWRQQGFKLTDGGIASLQQEKIPDEILESLRSLMAKNFTEGNLLKAMAERLSKEQLCRYQETVLKHTRGKSDREDIAFNWHSDWE
jgi:hypothetical protein